MVGIRIGRYYIDASQFPLTIVTDHRHLTFLKHARSPKVVGWVLEFVQDLNFRVIYTTGKTNLLPDALTRPPVIAPGIPSPRGEQVALESLIDKVGLRNVTSLWTNVIVSSERVKKIF